MSKTDSKNKPQMFSNLPRADTQLAIRRRDRHQSPSMPASQHRSEDSAHRRAPARHKSPRFAIARRMAFNHSRPKRARSLTRAGAPQPPWFIPSCPRPDTPPVSPIPACSWSLLSPDVTPPYTPLLTPGLVSRQPASTVTSRLPAGPAASVHPPPGAVGPPPLPGCPRLCVRPRREAKASHLPSTSLLARPSPPARAPSGRVPPSPREVGILPPHGLPTHAGAPVALPPAAPLPAPTPSASTVPNRPSPGTFPAYHLVTGELRHGDPTTYLKAYYWTPAPTTP